MTGPGFRGGLVCIADLAPGDRFLWFGEVVFLAAKRPAPSYPDGWLKLTGEYDTDGRYFSLFTDGESRAFTLEAQA